MGLFLGWGAKQETWRDVNEDAHEWGSVEGFPKVWGFYMGEGEFQGKSPPVWPKSA